MYEAYWQLDRKPFENTSDAEFYYPAEAHQGALLKLRYAVESRRHAALLAGPAGAGKTLVVQQLRKHLPDSFWPFVHMVFPKMPPEQVLSFLASELGAVHDVHQRQSVDETIRAIESKLCENASEGRHFVLAIDEAHLLDEVQTLEYLRLLLNFEVDGRPALTLLLVGQTGLLPILDRREGFEQRFDVKCLLRLLSLEESISYVNHRLAKAGAKRAIFDDAALEVLFQLTHGSPRQINRLCDLALLIGYAEELPAIGGDQIEAVSNELVSVSPE